MTATIIECSSRSEQCEAARQAADVLRRGGTVVFPTETVYGVGAALASVDGVEALRAVKGRTDAQPFTLHLPDVESIGRFVDLAAHPALMRLARRTMPGPVTLMVDVDDATIEQKLAAQALPPEARERLYHGNTLGLRVPANDLARLVLAEAGQPVVASSANAEGEDAPKTAAQAAARVGDGADLILDGGPARYGRASTIVRIDGERYDVLREGVYDQRYIEKLMRRNILFVCSGNTCRSPMAEAIARHELAQRLNTPVRKLAEQANVQVLSAGAFAPPGAPITPEAAAALEALGVPCLPHSSRPLTHEMLEQAEAIFCMTPSHLQAVQHIAPGAASRAMLLDPAGEAVDDPIGAGGEIYIECARQMQQLIRRRLDELGFGSLTPVEKRS